MSSEIENQIVSMQFDNKQFESGVNTSMSTLDKLKSSLNFTSKTNGLNDLQVASSKLDLSNADKQVSTITHHLNLLKTAGLVAFATIVRQATYMGERVAASFTIDPIKAGFSNYEQQINATKTILSNTAASGTKLKDVEATLKNLNDYANLTVYNFADMAKNIGTFTAAGVALKPATESIKGIANLAALSGSTSEQASSAMYQLSQAIAAGQVHLQDWNSVVNAGIGGTVFQRALAQTAVQMGTLDKSSVKLTGSMKNVSINGNAFRQSLTPPPGGTSWLTSKVLTNTLAQFTGDLSKAQLRAEGFSKAQTNAIYKQAQTAVDAATQVKTFSQLMQALKEEVASAWANVFKAIFGNINDATTFFTGLHNVLQNFLTAPINQLAKFLEQFRKAQGFIAVWDSFKNIFKVIGNLLSPIVQLFGALTPSTGKSAKSAANMAKSFEKFTEFLVKMTNPLQHVSGLLKPLVAIFHILGGYVGDVVDQFKKLSPIFAAVGDNVKGLEKHFEGIGTQILNGIAAGMAGSTDNIKKTIEDLGNNIIEWIKNVLGIHSPAATMIPIGLNIVQGIANGIIGASQFLIKALQGVFIGLGKAAEWAVKNISWSDVLSTINTALFFALVRTFQNFTKAFGGTMKSFRDVLGSGKEVLEQLSSSLKTMQNEVRSKIIRNIAISVALLAGAALLLSTIDPKKLAFAMGAIAGLMASLITSMSVLTSGGGGKHNAANDPKAIAKKTAQILAIGAAMIEFSTAVVIMAGAVAILGNLKPDTLKQGLIGVGAVITLIVTATAILGKTGGGATMLAAATSLLILSAALTAFVGVMKLYQKLDWKTLVRGGGAAAAVIAAVGFAMRAFGKGGAVGGSAGLVIASVGLIILAKALQKIAAISTGGLIKSIFTIGIVLTALAGAALVMSAAEGGAGSLLIMAGAIIVLAQALKIISKIPILDLIKAIGALVVVVGLMAGAAALLSPLIPVMSAFGIALALIGGAIFLAGTGILAFATAMGILAVVGPAAFQALNDGIDDLISALPKIAEALGKATIAYFTGIVEAAGPLQKAFDKLGSIILDALIELIPKGRKAARKLINALLDVWQHSYSEFYRAFWRLILGILQTLDDGVPKLINRGVKLIVAVSDGFAKKSRRVANAVGRGILEFLTAIDDAVNKYEPQIIGKGQKIGFDIVAGIVKGLTSNLSWSKIKSSVEHMADAIPGWAKKVLHISSPSKRMADEVGRWIPAGVAGGIDDNVRAVEDSAQAMANRAFDVLKETFANSKKSVNGLTDLKPKITPVLDLSQLEKDSVKMGNVFDNPKLTADVSRRGARDIASSEAAKGYGGHEPEGNTYNFNQTINSPKPVNAVKAYRGTKSQIALLKEVKG